MMYIIILIILTKEILIFESNVRSLTRAKLIIAFFFIRRGGYVAVKINHNIYTCISINRTAQLNVHMHLLERMASVDLITTVETKTIRSPAHMHHVDDDRC